MTAPLFNNLFFYYPKKKTSTKGQIWNLATAGDNVILQWLIIITCFLIVQQNNLIEQRQ